MTRSDIVYSSCPSISMRCKNPARLQWRACHLNDPWVCCDKLQRGWYVLPRHLDSGQCLRGINGPTINPRLLYLSPLPSKHFHTGRMTNRILFSLACKCATAALHCFAFSNSYTAGSFVAPSPPTSSSTNPKRSCLRSRPCSVPSNLTNLSKSKSSISVPV